ncbi:MAG: TlpA family protein disulfide reductase [Halanaeroarchaeum sp.]
MAERTTYPGGTGRLTVKGVETPGSTSGQLTINPPNTVSLVEFFATWCAPCKDQMSTLREVRSEFSRETVSFISITQENEPEAIREFWREYDGTWRVGIDPTAEVIQEFGVRGYPTAVVLLPDGTETARHVGSGSHGLASDVRQALEEAGL